MASTQSVVKAILDRALSNNDFSESAASLSDETLGELVMAGFDYDEDEKTLKLVDSSAAFTLYRSLLEAELGPCWGSVQRVERRDACRHCLYQS